MLVIGRVDGTGLILGSRSRISRRRVMMRRGEVVNGEARGPGMVD